MMVEFLISITQLVEDLGYIGIFFMTFVESTFIPIPAEITLVPAGYLIADGKMNPFLVSICSTFGTVGGALFNYSIARYYGRSILVRYGKYIFMNPTRLKYIEQFFKSHGAISTFSGRILPGVKHFISFPAGLAKMKLAKFVTYTALGGFVWNTVLITLGYYIGQEQALIKKYMHQINISLICCLAVVIYFYIKKYRNKI
jgi:membrane protein DedA with SNARE-associated domain